MNIEAIYFHVDYNNLMSNPVIKMMNDLSYRVHTNFSKNFLWVPYYGGVTSDESLAAENVKRVGYVANTTTIYDIVLLQPNYYFGAPQANLDGVNHSVQNQAVSYRNGVVVVPRKSFATATIGVQMEIDSNVSNSTRLKQYKEYENKFRTHLTSKPFGYYAGNRNSLINVPSSEDIYVYQYINSFYR